MLKVHGLLKSSKAHNQTTYCNNHPLSTCNVIVLNVDITHYIAADHLILLGADKRL